MSTVRAAAVLVLNYNGLAHLESCLGSLITAARRAAVPCAVVLVDNRSSDGSVEFARQRFPEVEVVVSPANDCLFSLNAVAADRPEDVVVVVNNDMRFEPAFVSALLPHFADSDVFAVGAAVLTWDGGADTVGPRCARIERGWLHKWWRYDAQQTALSLDACGGAAAYRRRMFVSLGGFDPLYRPGYYEDLDLSFRAWARGWKTIYEPRSRAYHKESVSMVARFGDRGKARLLYRNHLLFTIANVGGAAFLARFLLMLPYRVVAPLLRGYTVPLAGGVRALGRMPAAFWRRARRGGSRVDVRDFEQVRTIGSARVA
jgi:GT2 family glycosyltransferase